MGVHDIGAGQPRVQRVPHPGSGRRRYVSHYGLGRWPRPDPPAAAWLVSSGLTQAPAASVGPSCPSVPPLKNSTSTVPSGHCRAPLQHAGASSWFTTPCLSPATAPWARHQPASRLGPGAHHSLQGLLQLRSLGAGGQLLVHRVVHPPPPDAPVPGRARRAQPTRASSRRTGPHFSHRPAAVLSTTALYPSASACR